MSDQDPKHSTLPAQALAASDTAAAAARRVLGAKVVNIDTARRALILVTALRFMSSSDPERLVESVRKLRHDPRRAVQVLQNFRRLVWAGAA